MHIVFGLCDDFKRAFPKSEHAIFETLCLPILSFHVILILRFLFTKKKLKIDTVISNVGKVVHLGQFVETDILL